MNLKANTPPETDKMRAGEGGGGSVGQQKNEAVIKQAATAISPVADLLEELRRLGSQGSSSAGQSDAVGAGISQPAVEDAVAGHGVFYY